MPNTVAGERIGDSTPSSQTGQEDQSRGGRVDSPPAAWRVARMTTVTPWPVRNDAGSQRTTSSKEDPMPDPSDQISFDDFCKVKMAVGRIAAAADHPNADKLVVLQVDLGDERRQLVAGLKGHYDPDQLVGRNIIVVTNLAPRMMRGQESNGMLLAASTPDHARIILLEPDADIEPGSRVS